MRIIPLIEVLEKIEDPRSCHGRRYSLVSLLSACIAAILCGNSSYSSIAQWCENYSQELLSALGFKEKKPCAATFYNVLKALDIVELEKAVGHWVQSNFLSLEESLAIDGKTLRGAKRQGSTLYHLLSAVSGHLGITAYQFNVGEKTGEIKGFKDILKGIILEGKILTMDALLTQRDIAKRIVSSHCAYVMIAKDNQPFLKEDISNLVLFNDNIGETVVYQLNEKGHGRIETRTIRVCPAKDYIDWPAVAQVFAIEREITHKGKTTRHTEYGLTNLSSQTAQPKKLLEMVRSHWSVESKSHWVRDAVYREDLSQVHVGVVPQVMAALRNMAIGLIKAKGWKSVTKANRFYAANPFLSLELLFQIIK